MISSETLCPEGGDKEDLFQYLNKRKATERPHGLFSFFFFKTVQQEDTIKGGQEGHDSPLKAGPSGHSWRQVTEIRSQGFPAASSGPI